MMVGYAPDQNGNCFKMWNPTTGTIYIMHNIIWLKQIYFGTQTRDSEYLGNDNGTMNAKNENPESELDEELTANIFDEMPDGAEGAKRSGRSFRKIGGIAINPGAITPSEEKFYAEMKEMNKLSLLTTETKNEYGLVGVALGGGFGNTKKLKHLKYDEAMKTPDAPYWQDSVEEE